MELNEIIRRQAEADSRCGFSLSFDSDVSRHNQIALDLVGLVGEVGEFANLLKKVGLTLSVEGYQGPSLQEATPILCEELADTIIYIIRMSKLLKCDLEAVLLSKMQKNEIRYKYLEK